MQTVDNIQGASEEESEEHKLAFEQKKKLKNLKREKITDN